jgi:AraC-like DNA-binding protein
MLRTTELVFWVALARLGTRSQVKAMRVTTPEPPHGQDRYLEYFGAPVEEGVRQAITFSAEDAGRPFLTANERMWEFFEPGLRKRLAGLEEGSTTGERVRAALLELLPVGEGTMDAVAKKLLVSTRTLQRHLKEEGATFQGALAETRESLARHYLENSNLPTAEISFLLGYEEPNSFYRAFRAWTGETPERVRMAAM